jgi:hypothetical protein
MGPSLASPAMQRAVIHVPEVPYPGASDWLQFLAHPMAADAKRTLNGALAGAAAAGVWAAQQPLDKRVFGCGFDDVQLLGKAVTRGPLWPLAGLAVHLQNGAIFGAMYANLPDAARRVPAAPRGVLAALAEHVATWPAAGIAWRAHPARSDIDEPSFWQGVWRHALFGFVLAELERRLNPPDGEPEVDFEAVVSTNGHGRIEDAVSA